VTPPAALAVDALAAFRLTRLVVDDTILEAPRGAVVRFAFADGPARPARAKLAELIECYWCVGFWASAAVVVARRARPHTWAAIADALAISAVVGFLSTVS